MQHKINAKVSIIATEVDAREGRMWRDSESKVENFSAHLIGSPVATLRHHQCELLGTSSRPTHFVGREDHWEALRPANAS